MKKTVSFLLIAALLAAALFAGACARTDKTLTEYIDRQSAAAVTVVQAYLAEETDAASAQAAIKEIADAAAKDKTESPLKEILEKDVSDDAAFTVFEARLQLLLSNFNHFLLTAKGYEQGLVTEEDYAAALANHRAALEKQIGEDER